MGDSLLEALADGAYHSGEQLSQALGITRAAIWKRMEALRGQGYDIRAGGKRGYCLIPPEDPLMPPFFAVEGCVLEYAKELPSTNARAAELARSGAAHGTLVVAEQQTQGRGRRGRGWESPLGAGAWFSLILRAPLVVAQAQSLPLLTALAASKACGPWVPGIKWPNDLVLAGRKVGGILLEMSIHGEQVDWVVLGIGINVNQRTEDFPPELRDTATSMAMITGENPGRGPVIQAFARNFWQLWPGFLAQGMESFSEEYRARSLTLSQAVRVLAADGSSFTGMAESLGTQGELHVRDEQGVLQTVWAGDVSVRGLMGYV